MLQLTSKTPVKFLWSDSLSETAVILSPDDDSETLRDKLQRVLELTGEVLPTRQPGAALTAAQAEFPPLFPAAEAEAAVLAQQALGWSEDMDLDALPEA